MSTAKQSHCSNGTRKNKKTGHITTTICSNMTNDIFIMFRLLCLILIALIFYMGLPVMNFLTSYIPSIIELQLNL